MTEIAKYLLDEFDFPRLFAVKRVLEAANRALNLSDDFFAFSFGFKLGIIGDLADDFLHGTFGKQAMPQNAEAAIQ